MFTRDDSILLRNEKTQFYWSIFKLTSFLTNRMASFCFETINTEPSRANVVLEEVPMLKYIQRITVDVKKSLTGSGVVGKFFWRGQSQYFINVQVMITFAI